MNLSPSRLSTFLSCPQKYAYKYIQHLPDGSGQAAVNGTLVHSALEALYKLPSEDRTLTAALWALDEAAEAWPKVTAFVPETERCQELVWNLFDLEDPTTTNAKRTEMDMLIPWGDHFLRGIVDRLDQDGDGYVIVDYKTGKAPDDKYLDEKALGIKMYALMGLKMAGVPPTKVRLLYLGTPQIIEFDVSDAMVRSVERKALSAVEAMERGNFVAKPSFMCSWCSFNKICPSAKKSLTKKKAPTKVES